MACVYSCIGAALQVRATRDAVQQCERDAATTSADAGGAGSSSGQVGEGKAAQNATVASKLAEVSQNLAQVVCRGCGACFFTPELPCSPPPAQQMKTILYGDPETLPNKEVGLELAKEVTGTRVPACAWVPVLQPAIPCAVFDAARVAQNRACGATLR